MIMAKCCHDMDILQWVLGEKCVSVQSFGSLRYFTRENQPEGAPDRCTDGCPHSDSCHYNAIKLYTDPNSELWGWGRKAAAGTVDDPTPEQVWDALLNGPYGRCVYACDNDVVDHQVVNLEYESGCTASFTMSAFNKGGRFIRIFGTEGELISDLDQSKLRLYSFATDSWEAIEISEYGNDIMSGHGGGDRGIMVDTLSLLRGETPTKSICDVRTSYENHITGFAEDYAYADEREILTCILVPDTEEQYQKALDMGCRMFTSDDPATGVAVLKKLGKR
jgi:predicted dehydrogenase